MEAYELVNKQEIVTHENIVKKSRFIAMVFYIENQEQAEEIIAKKREEYKDARHVVFAYRLKSTAKFTDDKEPQGTAGKPIYSLLEKENMTNILIVVVRYFGGILLGAGPLTRAYSTVAKEALAKCEKKPYVEYIQDYIECEYKDEQNIKRNLELESCIMQNIIRTDKVKIEYLRPKK